jgi:hypothetical protein
MVPSKLTHQEKKPESQKKRNNWTVRQDTKFFKIWTISKLGINVMVTLIYPYYNVNGFPEWGSYRFVQLCALEFTFFIEIILKFFL